MAYMVSIGTSCNQDGCVKTATHYVYDTRNDRRGQFCRLHAQRRVDALTEAETKAALKVARNNAVGR